MNGEDEKGKVFLVGAGPGDAGLLTLRGKGILQRADVVIYDYLANRELLDLCNPDAERIYVGKKAGEHTFSQDEINEILIQKARSRACVARLKGGDPFILGRGGEEAEALEQAGVGFEIVPGVSSAVAVPAYAGIPLTHRRYASSVAIVTGHEEPSKEKSPTRWEHLAHAADTLVFLMGVKNLQKIVARLMRHGKDSQTPAAVVQWGTTTKQRTIVAPLEEIAQVARREGVEPPAVLVVGEVVSLRSHLAWFEKAPLFGRRILVTRSREQASELADRLRALGAEAVEFPTIRIRAPEDWTAVDRALDRLSQYDWVLFTSPNGVRFLLRRIKERGGDIRDLKGIRMAAIGPGTTQALEFLGVRVDLMPREYRAEALAEAFPRGEVKGKIFLLPRAEQAREVLPDRLRELGGAVDVVPVYRTVLPDDGPSQMRQILLARRLDAVTFTSSSTVRNFVHMVGKDRVRECLEGVKVACIGPVTAKTATEEGIEPHIQAQVYTIPGLVEALVDHFQRASTQ